MLFFSVEVVHGIFCGCSVRYASMWPLLMASTHWRHPHFCSSGINICICFFSHKIVQRTFSHIAPMTHEPCTTVHTFAVPTERVKTLLTHCLHKSFTWLSRWPLYKGETLLTYNVNRSRCTTSNPGLLTWFESVLLCWTSEKGTCELHF